MNKYRRDDSTIKLSNVMLGAFLVAGEWLSDRLSQAARAKIFHD